MKLDGGFTLGHWSCESKKISGEFVLPSGGSLIDALSSSFEADIKVEVKSFSCGSTLMEADMYRALKANEHPLIHFNQHVVSPSSLLDENEGGRVRVVSRGALKVAGVAKTKKFDMKITDEGDVIRVFGRSSMKMSDFGIKPPTALFGLIEADNALNITFQLDLQKG